MSASQGAAVRGGHYWRLWFTLVMKNCIECGAV